MPLSIRNQDASEEIKGTDGGDHVRVRPFLSNRHTPTSVSEMGQVKTVGGGWGEGGLGEEGVRVGGNPGCRPSPWSPLTLLARGMAAAAGWSGM